MQIDVVRPSPLPNGSAPQAPAADLSGGRSQRSSDAIDRVDLAPHVLLSSGLRLHPAPRLVVLDREVYCRPGVKPRLQLHQSNRKAADPGVRS